MGEILAAGDGFIRVRPRQIGDLEPAAAHVDARAAKVEDVLGQFPAIQVVQVEQVQLGFEGAQDEGGDGGLQSGLELYEIDAFISYKKPLSCERGSELS